MADISIEDFSAYLNAKFLDYVEEVVDVMKSEAPERTGALRESIAADRIKTTLYFVGPNVDYAKYVENGRGEVRPVKKKALHWFDGGDVFAMRSRAVKPNPFVKRTKSHFS